MYVYIYLYLHAGCTLREGKSIQARSPKNGPASQHKTEGTFQMDGAGMPVLFCRRHVR